MNDLMLEQNKFVFRLADDTLDDSQMRDFLHIDPVIWDNTRSRDKVKAARKMGYLSLGEVVEALVRPVYFKQILAGQTSMIENSEEFRELNRWDEIVDELLVKHDLKFHELRKYFPEVYESHFHAFVKSNAMVWRIHNEALRLMDPTAVLAPVELESFKKTPWPVRRTRMVKLLHHNWPEDLQEHLEIQNLIRLSDRLTDCIDDIRALPADYIDRVFVKSSRITGLCTLATPLF